jgi:hypothetical protein
MVSSFRSTGEGGVVWWWEVVGYENEKKEEKEKRKTGNSPIRRWVCEDRLGWFVGTD